MGKLLVIKGADFSNVAVPEDIPFDFDKYVQETASVVSPTYTDALVDADGKILYAKKTDGTIEDHSADVIGKTVTDGTLVTTIIDAYKNMN